MIKIGITGNIASGKSEVEKILKILGYRVYDLDFVCHNLLEKDKDVQEKVLGVFYTVDRKKLSDIVFRDKDEMKKLENIIYPSLRAKVEEFFKTYEDIVFVSGALIYEAGFSDLFDRILCVDAPYEIRLQRLMKRNNYTEKEARLRLDIQKANHRGKADYVIDNIGTVYELKQKIIRIINSF